MRQARFAPLDRLLSTVVLGTFSMSPGNEAESFAILDEWVSLGGNVLDTAQVYGDGDSERLLGRYLASSGRRAELVILSKGCHPLGDDRPRVTVEAIKEDLSGSLERLRTDHIDIYMLHRDDPTVPVGPLIEALNELQQQGHIRSFGASNWRASRIAEADRYAAGHGLAGFTSSSCQFSLAVQRASMCDGCVSARDPLELDHYARAGLPLFAWAALAGGFFRDGPQDDPDVERVFGSPANRERARRADELARRLGLTRSEVALAWVLSQPLPVFGIVASSRPEHLRAAVAASEVGLDAGQLAWLDLSGDDPG